MFISLRPLSGKVVLLVAAVLLAVLTIGVIVATAAVSSHGVVVGSGHVGTGGSVRWH